MSNVSDTIRLQEIDSTLIELLTAAIHAGDITISYTGNFYEEDVI